MYFDWELFLCAMGLAFVFEAMPWIIAPERLRESLLRLAEKDADELRRWGLVLLGTGILLIWYART